MLTSAAPSIAFYPKKEKKEIDSEAYINIDRVTRVILNEMSFEVGFYYKCLKKDTEYPSHCHTSSVFFSNIYN